MIVTLESKNLNFIIPNRDCFTLYAQFQRNTVFMKRHGFLKTVDEAWLALCGDAGTWFVRDIGIWVIQCKSTHQLIGTTGFWESKSRTRVFELDLLPYAVNQQTKQEIVKTMFEYHKNNFGNLDCCYETISELVVE